jgi:hypothetical protein
MLPVVVAHHATGLKPERIHMTMLTLGEASRVSGRGKTTLARAIRRGALSATRTETGYQIDAAELARAFPFHAPLEAAHHASPDATTDILVAALRATIEDLRKDRDHWRDAFEQSQRLLAATPATPPAQPSPLPQPVEPKPWSWTG